MRISDWSSDVCSSDLRASRRRTLSGRPAPVNGGSNAPSNARSRQERLPKDGNGGDHKEDPGNRVDGPDRRTRQAPDREDEGAGRPEARRVGEECVSKRRSPRTAELSKKQNQQK